MHFFARSMFHSASFLDKNWSKSIKNNILKIERKLAMPCFFIQTLEMKPGHGNSRKTKNEQVWKEKKNFFLYSIFFQEERSSGLLKNFLCGLRWRFLISEQWIFIRFHLSDRYKTEFAFCSRSLTTM